MLGACFIGCSLEQDLGAVLEAYLVCCMLQYAPEHLRSGAWSRNAKWKCCMTAAVVLFGSGRVWQLIGCSAASM